MSKDFPNTRGERMLAQRVAFLRNALSPTRRLRIADVGANPVNVPDYAGLLACGGCEVWGFEPEQTAFDALMAEDKADTHYVQCAIGKTGPATFHAHPQSGLGSLYEVCEPSVTFLGRAGWHRDDLQSFAIDLVTLDSLPDDELPKPDLLKIDIQGGELDAIATGAQKLSEAICIIPELRYFRVYKGEPMMGALDVELRRQGFALHKFLPSKAVMIKNSQSDRLKGQAVRSQLLDGDAVYIRDPNTIADWSDEQIKHLAMAAATIFDSFDLVVFCLDELVARGSAPPETPAGFVDLLPGWMLEESQ